MKEYLFIHECLGVIPEQNGFQWIWWCPGQKTQEGWEPYPENVTSKREGMPSHYLRDPKEIAADLQRLWLNDWFARQNSQQSTKAIKVALLDRLHTDLGSRLSQAILLSKLYLNCSPSTIVNMFRHYCSSYDSALQKEKDRLTETIRVHRELIEIMGVYRNLKDEILSVSDPEFELHKRLAKMSHKEIITEALKIINERRMQEVS